MAAISPISLSIVIPAFNEEKRLPACLASVRQAALECGLTADQLEVIVCDNNSTDGTAHVAEAAGATVAFEPINQIGRARNAGAWLAQGEWLLFIDADSFLNTVNLHRVIKLALGGTHVGGGCIIRFDQAPFFARLMPLLWNGISLCCRWAAGSFIFCRTRAFREIGGFSHEFFAAEEIDLSKRLKRWGREQAPPQQFTVFGRPAHVSSGRKFYLYSYREQITLLFRCVLLPFQTFKNQKKLDYFYDGRR
jgi:glycosyltransferase involved in cell wall biosynthesis